MLFHSCATSRVHCAMVEAGSKGGLSLMGMSGVVSGPTSLRHRIKRCDRLLGNSKLENERHLIYGAMARRAIEKIPQPLIIIDWSDLCRDRSRQLLRAALMVQGRALTLYEEVHPLSRATSLKVHRAFLIRLKAILPLNRRPIFVTDAGFRSTWFKLLDSMGYAWIGRIRNRDMVRPLLVRLPGAAAKPCMRRPAANPGTLGSFTTSAAIRWHVVWC
jgi:hypothetical protein